jgi:phage N-6-adenine-methyltransferase
MATTRRRISLNSRMSTHEREYRARAVFQCPIRLANPLELFERLDREFSFTLDVCATSNNTQCRRYFTPVTNGLRQRWTGRCWMNLPYGRAIAAWVQKAFVESGRGAIVVSLLPARTDTAWWHDGVMQAREIRFLRGRLTFVGAPSPAPFPSAIVIFNRRKATSAPRLVSWDWRAHTRVAASHAL